MDQNHGFFVLHAYPRALDPFPSLSNTLRYEVKFDDMYIDLS